MFANKNPAPSAILGGVAVHLQPRHSKNRTAVAHSIKDRDRRKHCRVLQHKDRKKTCTVHSTKPVYTVVYKIAGTHLLPRTGGMVLAVHVSSPHRVEECDCYNIGLSLERAVHVLVITTTWKGGLKGIGLMLLSCQV